MKKIKLFSLFLVLALSIGNGWGDVTVQVGNVDAVSDKDSTYVAGYLSDGTTPRLLYVKSNGTYTSTDIQNSAGIAVLYGNTSTTSAKMSSTSNLGPTLVSGGKTHVQVGVEEGDSVTVYWFHSSTMSNKKMTVSKQDPDNAAKGVSVTTVRIDLGTSKRTGCSGWKSTINGTAYFSFDNTLYVYAIKVTPKPTNPSITAFTIAGVNATIDEEHKTITATVPYKTAGWPSLTPSVTIGGSATGYSPSGAQDFSSPVTYTASDATNDVDYTVTITRAAVSTDNDIKSLTIAGNSITPSGTTYSYEVPYTDDSETVTVEYTINALASATPASGFTITVPAGGAAAATQNITVTAESGAQATYTVSVTKSAGASTDATLSDLQVAGATVDGFDADKLSYNYNISVYAAIPAVSYTLNDPSATAEYKVHNETMSDTIDVTAEDGTTTKRYLVTFVRGAATELSSISASTTWDFSKTNKNEIKLTASSLPTKSTEFVYADVFAKESVIPDPSFNASALAGIQEYVVREGKYCQGTQLRFNTSVTGTVRVTYTNTGGDRPYRHIEVNGTLSAEGSADAKTAKTTEDFAVSAGDVTIKVYIPDASSPQEGNDDVVGYTMARISKVVFTQTYAVNCAATTNGTLEADKALAAAGETVTLTITPAEGYLLSSLTVMNGVTPVEVTDNQFTMPAAPVTITATFAQAYNVTLAKGDNAITAGAAKVYVDATALTVTTEPTGKGALLGYYTAATEGTKVANADGTFVNETIAGYITSGQWSQAEATTLYAVFAGWPTGVDNTADEAKVVKFFENGQVVIFKDGKYYNVLGMQIR